MWPGYETQTVWFTDGIFLNADTATKFINTRTVLDDINGMFKDGYPKKEIVEWYARDKET